MTEFKNLITLTQVSDGAPGGSDAPAEDSQKYYIETNQEEILRFKEGEGYLYSPQTLTFKIYNNTKQINDQQRAISDNSYKLEYYGESGFQEIEKNQPKDDPILERGTSEGADPNTIYFSVSSFYESYTGVIQNGQIFRFSYLVDNEVAAIKIIQMRNGVTEDMATFGLYAGGFNAAIQETKLDFSSAGLSIMNGGIKIFKKHQYSFFETKDTTMQDNKDYYEKDEESENEIYSLTADTIFQSGKKYYERGEENAPSFWADTDGNLTLTGTIYATNGSFSGSLYSTDAEIGGFKIDDSKIYVPVKNENQDDDFTGSPLYLESSGHIYAKNITIGTGAVIEDFISLGDAKLFNPEENNGLILSADLSPRFLRYGRYKHKEKSGQQGEQRSRCLNMQCFHILRCLLHFLKFHRTAFSQAFRTFLWFLLWRFRCARYKV